MQKASIPHDALVFVGDGTRAVFFRNRGAIQNPTWRSRPSCGRRIHRRASKALIHRLIVVAPPKVLGALRQEFHKEVRDRVEAEVPKEVASYSLNDIKSELASWW
jgi:protein required for attachment to host cells